MKKKTPQPYKVAPWGGGGGWGYTAFGQGLTTCYPNVEDAELWAERLNQAYALGWKHANKEAEKKGPSK